MKKFFALITTLSIFCITANVSHSAEYWDITYGGNQVEQVRSIQQTTDGGYIVAGYTDSFGAGDFDFWVLKLDSNGEVIWQKTYGGIAVEEISSIQQTAEGGYIVLGYTYSFAAEGSDTWVLKLDINGDVTWQKTYGGNYHDIGSSIQQTTDGGYVINDNYGYDIRILKLDSSGNISWQKIYDGGDIDRAFSLQQTTDGGYTVAGYTYRSVSSYHDIWLLKLDINGDVTWQKTYGGSYHDTAFSIQQTTDGGYIVAGYTYSFGAGRYNAWVLKLNSSGDVTWQKTYGGEFSTYSARSIQQTTDGGYVVAGQTRSSGAGMNDAWVLKLNSSGDVTWQKTYGGSWNDTAFSIQQTTDGGYILGGQTWSFGAGESDIWVLKLNNNGEIPDCEIMGTSNATAANTSVTSQGNPSGIQSITVSITSTNAIPQETFAEPSVICSSQIDPDDDGVPYDEDNCPYIYNPNQEDTDTDGIGDACDNFPNDYDNDGVDDNLDNCFFTPNPAQINSDSDTFGDECDNCPTVHNPDQTDYDGDNIGDACDDRPFLFEADGHYENYYYEECTYSGGYTRIEPGIEVTYNWGFGGGGMFCDYGFGSSLHKVGIMEFDISNMDGLFASGQIQANLLFTVAYVDLLGGECLSLYSIQDTNENGVIEEIDIDTDDFIGEICADLQPGDTITFDVTATVEHDLFDPDQTIFSGFIIDRGQNWDHYCWGCFIAFYDHTVPAFAPRLSISEIDSDSDGIPDSEDNCPYHNNPNQEDTYPPQGNNIGDACDCECDFDCSGGVDAIDVTSFLTDFGRSTHINPCSNAEPCNGDVDCNVNVDAGDVNKLLEDFGRSQFFNPCPTCVAGDWCVYP